MLCAECERLGGFAWLLGARQFSGKPGVLAWEWYLNHQDTANWDLKFFCSCPVSCVVFWGIGEEGRGEHRVCDKMA